MSLVFDDDSALLLGINDLTRCLRLHHFCLYPVILFGRLRQSWGVFGTWRGAGWGARIWTSVPNFYIDLLDLLRDRFWSSLIQPALPDFGIHWFSRNWFIVLEAGVIIHLELWYLLERWIIPSSETALVSQSLFFLFTPASDTPTCQQEEEESEDDEDDD